MDETPVTVTLSQMAASALITQLDRYFAQSFELRFAKFNSYRSFPDLARFQSYETDLIEARVATKAALAVSEGIDVETAIHAGKY
jgi:hypothetical protein